MKTRSQTVPDSVQAELTPFLAGLAGAVSRINIKKVPAPATYDGVGSVEYFLDSLRGVVSQNIKMMSRTR